MYAGHAVISGRQSSSGSPSGGYTSISLVDALSNTCPLGSSTMRWSYGKPAAFAGLGTVRNALARGSYSTNVVGSPYPLLDAGPMAHRIRPLGSRHAGASLVCMGWP